MRTIILRTASEYLLPLLLLFSVFILLRGHYYPGGGFIGGLIAAIAFVLHSFASGLDRTKHLLIFEPHMIMSFGLALSFLSGLVPVMVSGLPFMTGIWYPDKVAVIGSIGTILFFDIGVYLVVVGATLTILFSIAETA